MYNLNRVIVIVFNSIYAYARGYISKNEKKKKRVVRIANLPTIKTKSSPQFSSPMYYLFIVVRIYVHGSFSLWNYVHGSFFYFLDLENGKKKFHQNIWYHKKNT